MSDNQEAGLSGQDELSFNDSDMECNQSVCSDTHSDNTTISEMTEKSSASISTIHATSSIDDYGDIQQQQQHLQQQQQQNDRKQYGSTIPIPSTSTSTPILNRALLLPWGVHKDYTPQTNNNGNNINIDTDVRPGEYVMKSLFHNFTLMAEKKIESVMSEPQEKPLSKLLQRGEDQQFDQLLSAFGCVAEHCLPSLLRALYSWYERQMADVSNHEQKKADIKQKSIIYMVAGNSTETVERSEVDIQKEKRDLAVEFIFCLVLIEVLKQLSFHPGHDDLVLYIENLAFKHFKYREGIQSNPNGSNIHMISDLYAEVIGVLAQSRFQSVRTRFMNELKELRSREASTHTTQSIISLLIGMKFFRVKMVPIEEFEASFQFMQECAQYFLEVKDKDIKYALAGLFVEILVPVAAAVKNEVNVPCLKNFVEMLYPQTLDASTKSKHRLALFPLVTCLLCVSQKQFFLQNWHYFLAMCLSHLKNRDPKMCRVALESLYRLLWVYMIRIKCESNSATQSRLQSIVNSLFPKGSKSVIPRDTPLNIFVKIIQFIAQERLDFAMREIVFDLLSVGRPIKIILTPERMSIGLRAFLVVADSLQQKEGEPPMPRSVGVLPSGNTLRVRKTFLNKMLTDDTARSIGISAYFPHVRRVFVDILRALDQQYGRPLMMTNTQNLNKEPDEMITGERKPRIDLFRTCVAAVPRLIPDGMTGSELVDLLSRLTVHMDEELRGLAYQSLQTLVIDFPDWRQDVLWGLTQFISKDVLDTFPTLIDNGLKMILTLLCAWKGALINNQTTKSNNSDNTNTNRRNDNNNTHRSESTSSVLHLIEALSLVMLCNYRITTRRVSVLILKEIKCLLKILNCSIDDSVIDVIDKACPLVIEKLLPQLPPIEKQAIQQASLIDLQWLADRNTSTWNAGLTEDGSIKSGANYTFNVTDPWSLCLFSFLESDCLLTLCPSTIVHSWPIVFTRLNALFSVVDPTPLNDNRASLLRSSTALKKPPIGREQYMHLWKNYITFAFRVVPHMSNTIVRCASPDLSLSSSPDSLNTDKSDNKSTTTTTTTTTTTSGTTTTTNISPTALYKLIVPLLRCEVVDVRDAAVYAVGNVNGEACRDLLEELIVFMREAIDKKQENVRRRRRRDALRLHLMRTLEYIAEHGTFSINSCILDKDTQALHPPIVEFIEGVRSYLENESDKTSTLVKDLTLHFAYFLKKLIKSFSLETCRSLFSRNLRKSLFQLFSCWAGKYGLSDMNHYNDTNDINNDKLEFVSLQAMSAILCCGPYFDVNELLEDNSLYQWLDVLLNSNDEKVYNLAQETIILLLESNPDVGSLLDWVVDKCYTGTWSVADGCFLALATIFSAREYPCDHYTAIINVTLMNTGCPRPTVRDTALQLLQLLDKRFFGSVGPLAESDLAEGDKGRSTLDTLLATTYCRSQVHLSRQLALLHPELTMPMFSEITYRFQSARPEVRQLLLTYLLPWLHNMELVDPNLPPSNQYTYQFYAETGRSRKEGWGSAEATEMVLNNIFYITAKFGDNHPKEIEELWATLCTSWPNNMKVIIRYLIIISGMAPNELLPYTKRVVLYLARVQPVRLLDEMMMELQTVETLNCLIERTETPPFYRLTVMRKTSSHSDGTNNGNSGTIDSNTGRQDLNIEKGTIHTKRHSGEDPSKLITTTSGTTTNPTVDRLRSVDDSSQSQQQQQQPYQQLDDENFRDLSVPQPHPLPMPEYGGYFAPLTEYLPDSSQPISSFHRCNVGVMLLCDVVIDGIELDWTIHIPLILHILFLGLDHTRPLVFQHCKQLLLNILIVLAQHNDHLTVAHLLLNNKTNELELGLTTPQIPILKHNFTEPGSTLLLYWDQQINNLNIDLNKTKTVPEENVNDVNRVVQIPPVIVTPEDSPASTSTAATTTTAAAAVATNHQKLEITASIIIKSLIDYLSKQNSPLWNYEDITAKVWTIKSAEQIDIFLQHILKIFQFSLPNAHINERWSQTALQLGLSCSSRHYAGRSLQIYRALRVPITSRMLSDILSRLVETVAEHGEDMQGYVTELLLTLEAAVESLESDFRPLDFMRDFFKSTPNLNNKEIKQQYQQQQCQQQQYQYDPSTATILNYSTQQGHARSTSYSVSYGLRRNISSPNDGKERNRNSSTEMEHKNKFSSNLSRSRSAQSLKLLSDTAQQDDKLTILSQLFWLAVSLLESDYEHEFLLAVRLLARVMIRLPLDRPDARDKVEKLQQQLRWSSFPGVHALLLKGCTHPNIYEPVATLLSQLTPLLNLVVIDPSQSIAFPMNVIALLPYMLLNYEDANEICIRSAENISQVCIEKSKKLENLGTVMNLYSRRTFSKESFQWTKCVIKYLYDTYSHLSFNMLTFLIEVLEKGPNNLQLPILNIIHCILHYVDLNAQQAHAINTDLLRVIVKYIEGVHWKEALKILKLVVTRSSSLVAPPVPTTTITQSQHQQQQVNYDNTTINPTIIPTPHPSFADESIFTKKELPGRTMEFTFDMSQTPVIGRRFFNNNNSNKTTDDTTNTTITTTSSTTTLTINNTGGNSGSNNVLTPRRSCSLSPADVTLQTGWKRPWMSQGRVRECLVNLLTTCGQRVGLPKSPSVIFSQTSDIIERQSSMASSTEEMSNGNNDISGGSRRDDAATEFGVFKDFDFLEYESESIEGESTDNFNWGVRRRPLSQGEEEHPSIKQQLEDSCSEKTPMLTVRKRLLTEESSDDEVGSESPLDEIVVAPEFEHSSGETTGNQTYPPSSLGLREHNSQILSSARSDTSGSSAGDLGEVTPCNTSPNLSGILTIRPLTKSDVLDNWTNFIQNNMIEISTNTLKFFHQLQNLIRDCCNSTIEITKEACFYMLQSTVSGLPTIKLICCRLNSMIDIITYRILPYNLIWFNATALNDTKFIENLKYGMLEVQEHLETFCDKREQAAMYCNAVKATLKIDFVTAQHPSLVHHEHYLLDLGRSLYKLYFQLLLLIESGNKIILTLYNTLISAELKDITLDIVLIRNSLKRYNEDNETDGGTSPTLPTIQDLNLYKLIEIQKYSTVLTYYKLNRDEIIKDNEDLYDSTNDIRTILNLYCKKTIEEKPDSFIMTNQEGDLADIFGRLFQVSAAISDLENVIKNTTAQLEKPTDSKI